MTTSPKNTDLEQPSNLPVKVGTGSLVQGGEPSATDIQVAELQGKLVTSEDARKEERFLWFVLSGLLLVTIIFMGGGAAAGGFASLIYLAMVMVLSKRWGFEDLWEALHAAKKLIGGGKDKED